ncbi:MULTISPECIES: putative immunity protein [Streptomyces]|uniref:putative immunity protein n=1 Tax=Streptomyces TaxID=1883 RepID=UPI00140D3E40|nr:MULTISPECIES: exonuclease SbcC [Streptomyces]MDH6224014.1 hypothetical protein [Streptomyces sp. MJP52]
MTERAREIDLSRPDLREVTGFAATCAEAVLGIFEAGRPDDPRPRRAVDAAREFARGGERGKALRDAAWAALRAARAAQEAEDAEGAAASEAARAAMAAAGAAYLHPLAKATQVKHILGSAAHAARAAELLAGGDRTVGERQVRQAASHATPAVADVLRRYPQAPSGGGRTGELLRLLDAVLRAG